MSASDNCKEEGASKSKSDDDVCEMNNMLQNMCVAKEGDIVLSVCANCGKEGSSDEISNICNKCNAVKYCNAVCKKVHKKKHKKDCEEHQRRAAEKRDEELKLAVELHDAKLFKQPPPAPEDCPICFQRLPTLHTGRKYMACCGKLICSGCIHAPVYDNQGNEVAERKCPFCRTPEPTTVGECNERERKRMELNDPIAINSLGCYYRDGRNGYPQDHHKALELWHQAGELGHSEAYVCLGYAYQYGRGVEVDSKEAKHYNELAAMRGGCGARGNLGVMEANGGNFDRAMKHLIIAVRGGHNKSLEMIQKMYTNGLATKDDYTKALQSYQEYLSEIKSPQRDKAAAAREDCRYY